MSEFPCLVAFGLSIQLLEENFLRLRETPELIGISQTDEHPQRQ